jgi:hypothetical protein
MKKNNNRVLIIGKLPPPIGGVTIHVKRLLSNLELNKINSKFIDLTIWSLILLPFYLWNSKLLHIHSSSVFVRLYCTIISRICNKISIVTIHGDLGRFKSNYKNFIDKISVRITNYPIVLNQLSYEKSITLNSKSKIISSFIPPNDLEDTLNEQIVDGIHKIKNNCKIVFCTNAYGLSFDKFGNEIYGIFEIIEYFNQNENYGLIFSDPSGNYFEEFKKRNIVLNQNILHINYPHSFYSVLKLADVSIRNTTTDGDSISVKESLYLNKITLCTNVVSRPNGVITYNQKSITSLLDEFHINIKTYSTNLRNDDISGFNDILKLYNKILQ